MLASDSVPSACPSLFMGSKAPTRSEPGGFLRCGIHRQRTRQRSRRCSRPNTDWLTDCVSVRFGFTQPDQTPKQKHVQTEWCRAGSTRRKRPASSLLWCGSRLKASLGESLWFMCVLTGMPPSAGNSKAGEPELPPVKKKKKSSWLENHRAETS